MLPTEEIEKVESAKSAAPSWPLLALVWRSLSSSLIVRIDLFWHYLMLGTVRPSGESIAIEKLWSCLITYRWINPSSSRSLSIIELTIGNSVIAIEQALIKKGNIVNFGFAAFISFLKAINLVASISSEKVKKGIDSDSVIVLVIAFLIPVIYLTLHNKASILGLVKLTSLHQ